MKRIGLVLAVVLILTPSQARAGDVRDFTYGQIMAGGDQWARGVTFGAFVASPMSCPPGVSSAVLQSTMFSLVAQGVAASSDTFISVFYRAAKIVGCAPNR